MLVGSELGLGIAVGAGIGVLIGIFIELIRTPIGRGGPS